MKRVIGLLLLLFFSLSLTTLFTYHSLTPRVSAQSDLPRTPLSIGLEVIVQTPKDQDLVLRSEPTQKSDIVVKMRPGLGATIIDGPIFESREEEPTPVDQPYEWWKLRADSGDEGWAIAYLDDFRTIVPAIDLMTKVPCVNALEPRLTVGNMGRMMSDTYGELRDGPGSAFNLVEQIPGLGTFTILAGPRCNNNMQWWQVESTFDGERGWLPESDENGLRYWIEPVTPEDQRTGTPSPDENTCKGALETHVEIGMIVETTLTTDPIQTRTRPTNTGLSNFLVYPRQPVEVVSGPLCFPVDVKNSTWWLVKNQNGAEAWIPESNSGNYFLKVYVPPTLTPTRTPTPMTPTATITRTLDPTDKCLLTMIKGAYVWDGPTEEFGFVGSRAEGEVIEADGKHYNTTDLFTWWKLKTGEWIREDRVKESEDCAIIPPVEPIRYTVMLTMAVTPTVAPATMTPTPSPVPACTLTAISGMNVRKGPGSNYEVSSTRQAGEIFGADGQYTTSDGQGWWHLTTNEWVWNQLTYESDGCATLPVVQP